MGAMSKVSHICIDWCHCDPRRREGELSQAPTECMRTLDYVKDRTSLGQED